MKHFGFFALAMCITLWTAGCGGGSKPEVVEGGGSSTSTTANSGSGTTGTQTAVTPPAGGGTVVGSAVTTTESPSTPQVKLAPGKKLKLAFVTNASADFWSYAEAGTKKAAQEFDDLDVIFKVGDGTTGTQKRIIDDLIVSGVKGIAFSAIDPNAQIGMINQWSKKIPVICCDSDAPASDRITYLGTDNIAGGWKVGELVKHALPEGGKIMVFVGIADVANAKERYQGLKDSLAAATGKKYEILGLKTDNVDFAKARRNAEDTLNAHPDVDAMVGLWEYNPPQILNALKEKGKLGKVKVIGFDENFATLRAIDEGDCTGTVVQQPFEFGYKSIKTLRDVLIGGKNHEEAGIPKDKLIYIETKVITKGKGAGYIEFCEGLLESVKDGGAKKGAKVEPKKKVLPVQQARNLQKKINDRNAAALSEIENALK